MLVVMTSPSVGLCEVLSLINVILHDCVHITVLNASLVSMFAFLHSRYRSKGCFVDYVLEVRTGESVGLIRGLNQAVTAHSLFSRVKLHPEDFDSLKEHR